MSDCMVCMKPLEPSEGQVISGEKLGSMARSNQEIAKTLGLSEKVVEERLARIRGEEESNVCMRCHDLLLGTPDRAGYWQANMRVIGVLLLIWASVSYGCGILFVESLNRFTLVKLPLGFWFAQQGSLFVFVILIFVYAFIMDRIDRRFGVRE